MPNPSRAENRQDLQTEVQPERRIMKLELGDFGEVEARAPSWPERPYRRIPRRRRLAEKQIPRPPGRARNEGMAIATVSDVMLK
jgi:hypothetical protein